MSNKYGFAHQDQKRSLFVVKVLILRSKKERSGETTTQKKYDATHSNAMRKLDENGETFKVDKVNPKVTKAYYCWSYCKELETKRPSNANTTN